MINNNNNNNNDNSTTTTITTMTQQQQQQQPSLSLQQQILSLSTLPGNETCADCDTKNPKWASINLCCFICIQCSGIHRSLGTHITKVKSITMDLWTQEEFDMFVQIVDNASLNEIFEAYMPSSWKKPTQTSSMAYRKEYIIAKYVNLYFTSPNNDHIPGPKTIDTTVPTATATASASGIISDENHNNWCVDHYVDDHGCSSGSDNEDDNSSSSNSRSSSSSSSNSISRSNSGTGSSNSITSSTRSRMKSIFRKNSKGEGEWHRSQSVKRAMKKVAENSSSTGQVVFSGILTIKLMFGKDLVAMDVTGTSDPYCIFAPGPAANPAILYPGQAAKSAIQWKTLNPIWNEMLTVSIADIATDVLHVEVWDKDSLSRDDPMGHATIILKDVFAGKDVHNMEEEHVIDVKLQDVKSGIIVLGLSFVCLQ